MTPWKGLLLQRLLTAQLNPWLLQKWKVHYSLYMSSPLALILMRLNPILDLTSYFEMLHLVCAYSKNKGVTVTPTNVFCYQFPTCFGLGRPSSGDSAGNT
jgi:hypothetical protein